MIMRLNGQGPADCPSRAELFALTVGRLRGASREAVELHLEECASCLSELQSLDDGADPLIAELRGSAQDAGPFRVGDPPGSDAPGPSDRDGSEAAIAWPIPERLGDYQVLELLGRGGMGAVYRAVHSRMERVVAIKVLRPDWAGDRRAIDRFGQEIKAISSLEHPSLVRAYDAREEAGVSFLVMEYVEGLDLARLVGLHGPLPIADACEAIRQAAEGLEYAHRERGIVHRDIKPSNLMIDREGRVKVLDLGIARLEPRCVGGSRTRLTGVDERLGTHDYMAPEQWLTPGAADIRADIYGLGCTLYELLAGRPPFAGPEHATSEQKMLAHAIAPPPTIRKLRPDVPAALAEVLERMLAKSPADRYATPADLARALRPFTRGHDLPALVPPALGPPLLSPERASAPSFIPTIQAGRPVGPRKWDRPRTPSKPIAVPAALALLTLLLLAHTIAQRWRSPDADRRDAPGASAPASGPAAEAVDEVGAELAVRLYDLGPGPDDAHDLGRIGFPRSAARLGQHAVVEAVLDEPLFPYLFAVNPDGTCQSLFPEGPTDLRARNRFVFPNLSKYLDLDEAGLVGLVLLGSRSPLANATRGMPDVDAEEWKGARTEVPWSFDGERCEPLIADRAGGVSVSAHGLRPFTRLCRSLIGRPGIATVRAIAFTVKPAARNP